MIILLLLVILIFFISIVAALNRFDNMLKGMPSGKSKLQRSPHGFHLNQIPEANQGQS